MKRLWWFLLDELCALSEENLATGNFELHLRADGMLYVYPRRVK